MSKHLKNLQDVESKLKAGQNLFRRESVEKLVKEFRAEIEKTSTPPPPSLPIDTPITVLVLLGSLAIHIEEFFSVQGHSFDRSAIESILSNADLRKWIDDMDAMAFLPKKRN